MKDTLIIIPAFNEGKIIGRLLNNLLDNGVDSFADILVINDRSIDNTAKEVLSYSKKVLLISHIFNLGYGSSLKTGYSYASINNYRYVIQMDADGQHAVDNVRTLYDRIREDNTDIVIGSRFLKESKVYKVSLLRRFAIAFFRLVIRMFTKKVITDPTSGLQALSRRAFTYYSDFMNFDPRYPDANMIIKMLLRGYKIEEIPCVMYERTMGKSIHSGLKPILYMVLMLLSTLTVILQSKSIKSPRGEIV